MDAARIITIVERGHPLCNGSVHIQQISPEDGTDIGHSKVCFATFSEIIFHRTVISDGVYDIVSERLRIYRKRNELANNLYRISTTEST